MDSELEKQVYDVAMAPSEAASVTSGLYLFELGEYEGAKSCLEKGLIFCERVLQAERAFKNQDFQNNISGYLIQINKIEKMLPIIYHADTFKNQFEMLISYCDKKDNTGNESTIKFLRECFTGLTNKL